MAVNLEKLSKGILGLDALPTKESKQEIVKCMACYKEFKKEEMGESLFDVEFEFKNYFDQSALIELHFCKRCLDNIFKMNNLENCDKCLEYSQILEPIEIEAPSSDSPGEVQLLCVHCTP